MRYRVREANVALCSRLVALRLVPSPSDTHASALGPSDDLSFQGELKRKALHVLALVVPGGMHVLGMPHALYVLLPLTTIGVAGDVARAYSMPFNRFIRRVFGPMMRLRELPPPGRGVVINGATWVLVAATLLALVFPLRVAVPIFTMFLVSDAVAALVGRHWGRHHWGSTPRTIEGSAAFLTVGLGVMGGFSALPFALGVVATIVACVAEALPHPGNDNVRAPMVSALAVVVLEWAWLGQSVALFPVLRGG